MSCLSHELLFSVLFADSLQQRVYVLVLEYLRCWEGTEVQLTSTNMLCVRPTKIGLTLWKSRYGQKRAEPQRATHKL